MVYVIEKTQEFEEWLTSLSAKHEALILSRLAKIQDEGYFGEYRILGNGLIELKWKNGTRIYFIRIEKNKIRVLLGGSKNGQKKDIAKARKMF